jgi:hypothetical protein
MAAPAYKTAAAMVSSGLNMSRIFAALIAGAIAITLNSLLLRAADLISLATAHGGLLRLLQITTGIHLPATAAFRWEFHAAVGMAMAIVYAFVLEPSLPGASVMKGLLCAFAVWVLNAAVVLPLTGERFAGSRHLTLAGMAWFAAAHTAFFVCLALLYARFIGKAPARGASGRQGRLMVDGG